MKTKEKLFPTPLLIVLITAISILIVSQAYFNKKIKIKNTPSITNSQLINNTNIPEALPTNPPLEFLVNRENNWTTVVVPSNSTSGYAKFSISYPNDWKVTEGADNPRFSLAKNDFVIIFNQPSTGGSVCLFKDTKMKDVPDWHKDNPIYNSYTEIIFKQGKIRRFEIDAATEDNKKHFTTCELLNGTKLFETPLNGAVLSIITPINSSSSNLEEIDRILSTYQYEK